MGTFMRVVAALVLVAVVAGVGTAVYNAGVTAGLAQTAAEAADAEDSGAADHWSGAGEGPYARNPFGFGMGIMSLVLGTLFALLLIVIIGGLARIAFGMGRGGPGGGPGGGGWGGRRDRIEEWHRDLHRREGGDGEQHPAEA